MATETYKPPSLVYIDIEKIEGVLNGVAQRLIDARSLHNELNVGGMFSRWIRERIEQFCFVEGRDFIRIDMRPGVVGDKASYDYHLCPVAALRIALAQRLYKGVHRDLLRQVAFFQDRFLRDNPVHARVLHYLSIKGLTDAERAGLMSWSNEQWAIAVNELKVMGVWNVQPQFAATAA